MKPHWKIQDVVASATALFRYDSKNIVKEIRDVEPLTQLVGRPMGPERSALVELEGGQSWLISVREVFPS